MRTSLTVCLVLLFSAAAHGVLRGKPNSCLMCSVKRIAPDGIDNMSCTHDVPCPTGMNMKQLREAEELVPDQSVSGYLTTSAFIEDTKSFLIFSILGETFDKNPDIDLGNSTGLARADCVWCETDIHYATGWAVVKCNDLGDECPSQLSTGIRFKPPAPAFVDADVMVQYCFATRDRDTDVFLCRDNFAY